MVKWQPEISCINGAGDDSSFDSVFSVTGEAADGAVVLQLISCTFASVSEPQTWIHTQTHRSGDWHTCSGHHLTSLCGHSRKLTKSQVLKKPQKMHYRISKAKRNVKYPLYALISDE